MESVSNLIASHPIIEPMTNKIGNCDGESNVGTDERGIGPVTQGFMNFNEKLQEASLFIH